MAQTFGQTFAEWQQAIAARLDQQGQRIEAMGRTIDDLFRLVEEILRQLDEANQLIDRALGEAEEGEEWKRGPSDAD